MRWIVGDIQGCARALEALLAELELEPGRDELWAAGDLINRGPDSLATLRLWRSLGAVKSYTSVTTIQDGEPMEHGWLHVEDTAN